MNINFFVSLASDKFYFFVYNRSICMHIYSVFKLKSFIFSSKVDKIFF